MSISAFVSRKSEGVFSAICGFIAINLLNDAAKPWKIRLRRLTKIERKPIFVLDFSLEMQGTTVAVSRRISPIMIAGATSSPREKPTIAGKTIEPTEEKIKTSVIFDIFRAKMFIK